MKRCLLVLLLGLGLAACNDNDHDDQVSTEKPALAPSLDVGTYIISTETDQNYLWRVNTILVQMVLNYWF